MEVQVVERGGHALYGAELRAQAQGQQHEEEDDGPEGRRGPELHDGLREDDEGQTRTLRTLSHSNAHTSHDI